MSKQLSILLIPLILAACARPELPSQSQSEQEALRCSAYGGIDEPVCSASIYSVIVSPSSYYGRVVAFRGFVHKHQSGVIAVYPSEEIALNSDGGFSVLCTSDTEVCGNYVGSYAEVFGTFTSVTNSDSLFKPVGTIALVHVRSHKPPHGR